jgi:hypothetical protein
VSWLPLESCVSSVTVCHVFSWCVVSGDVCWGGGVVE